MTKTKAELITEEVYAKQSAELKDRMSKSKDKLRNAKSPKAAEEAQAEMDATRVELSALQSKWIAVRDA